MSCQAILSCFSGWREQAFLETFFQSLHISISITSFFSSKFGIKMKPVELTPCCSLGPVVPSFSSSLRVILYVLCIMSRVLSCIQQEEQGRGHVFHLFRNRSPSTELFSQKHLNNLCNLQQILFWGYSIYVHIILRMLFILRSPVLFILLVVFPVGQLCFSII